MNIKIITRASLVSLALLAPSLALAGDYMGGGYAIGCGNYICWLGQLVLFTINSIMVPVLFAVAFVVFLYGIAKAYVFSNGEPAEVSKGHKLIMWGIVAFAVMISIWGLVNVVADTFGLTGFSAPILPTSPTYSQPY